jgi:thiamine-phosphate pyrophosphorylase
MSPEVPKQRRPASLARPDSAGPLRRERLRTARLYFVCDARPYGEDPEALLLAALNGGADMIELREKELGRREIDISAATFRRLCDTYSALFVVNDDPDLARSVRADGVHVGQEDISPDEARDILGPDHLIGLSTHSEEQIVAAAKEPVDYISVGPIWETPTKEGRPATGLGLLGSADRAGKPFFAIGGINPANVGEVVQAGGRRLCVVRAIRDAEDPAAAAAALRAALPGEDQRPGG